MSLTITLGNLVLLHILFGIAITLLPNTISENVQDTGYGRLFLYPWKNETNAPMKIIDFNKNGDIIKTPIPSSSLINLVDLYHYTSNQKRKRFIKYIRSDDSNTWNSTLIFDELLKNINKTYNGQTLPQKKKLKILTHCKAQYCRFLTCPKIEDYCTLCEVDMKDHQTNRSTKCEQISTAFLFRLRNGIN